MPARIGWIFSLVCKKALTMPAHQPAGDGEQDAEIGVGGVGEYGGDGRAEGKAAVDRQIGDIEDAVGDEEAERDKRVDEPQLHGAL